MEISLERKQSLEKLQSLEEIFQYYKCVIHDYAAERAFYGKLGYTFPPVPDDVAGNVGEGDFIVDCILEQTLTTTSKGGITSNSSFDNVVSTDKYHHGIIDFLARRSKMVATLEDVDNATAKDVLKHSNKVRSIYRLVRDKYGELMLLRRPHILLSAPELNDRDDREKKGTQHVDYRLYRLSASVSKVYGLLKAVLDMWLQKTSGENIKFEDYAKGLIVVSKETIKTFVEQTPYFQKKKRREAKCSDCKQKLVCPCCETLGCNHKNFDKMKHIDNLIIQYNLEHMYVKRDHNSSINHNNNCEIISGNDTMGRSTKGNNITGNDTPGNNIMGNDTMSDDTTGNDTMGSDITGNNITGNEINGNDTTGNDIRGNDTTDNDNTGNDIMCNDTMGIDTARDDITLDDTTDDDITLDNNTIDNNTMRCYIAGNSIMGNDNTGKNTTRNGITSNVTSGDSNASNGTRIGIADVRHKSETERKKNPPVRGGIESDMCTVHNAVENVTDKGKQETIYAKIETADDKSIDNVNVDRSSPFKNQSGGEVIALSPLKKAKAPEIICEKDFDEFPLEKLLPVEEESTKPKKTNVSCSDIRSDWEGYLMSCKDCKHNKNWQCQNTNSRALFCVFTDSKLEQLRKSDEWGNRDVADAYMMLLAHTCRDKKVGFFCVNSIPTTVYDSIDRDMSFDVVKVVLYDLPTDQGMDNVNRKQGSHYAAATICLLNKVVYIQDGKEWKLKLWKTELAIVLKQLMYHKFGNKTAFIRFHERSHEVRKTNYNVDNIMHHFVQNDDCAESEDVYWDVFHAEAPSQEDSTECMYLALQNIHKSVEPKKRKESSSVARTISIEQLRKWLKEYTDSGIIVKMHKVRAKRKLDDNVNEPERNKPKNGRRKQTLIPFEIKTRSTKK